MPVQILSGRTRRLLPHILREIGEAYAAGTRCMLLVPEQYTLQAEIELVEALDLPGFFDLEVLSPTRLTHRVFERAGAPQRVRIDQRGKHMVLRCVLEDLSEDLQFYRRTGARAGFVDKLTGMIADLKRGGVSPEALMMLCETLPPDTPLCAKLEDVSRAFAEYERRLAGRFVDGEDVERAMRERLPNAGLLEGVRVWVYGFDMLTEQFSHTLAVVAAQADALSVALVMDAPPSRDAALYEPVRASAERFVSLLAEQKVSVQRIAVTGELPGTPALAHLERELYAYPSRRMAEKPEGISLHAAATPYAEAQQAAAQILAWVREDDLAWGDIVVQYTDAGTYAGLLRHVFALYGIPAYIDEKVSAANHPLVIGLLAALRCVTRGWRHEDAVLYLKSGFAGLTDEEGFVLERYALEYGLRGARWKQPLLRGAEALRQRVEPLRARFAEPLTRLQESLRLARDADSTLRAIFFFLQRISAFEALERYRGSLEHAELPAEAAHSAQVWNHLMQTMDQMHALLDGQRATSAMVLEMLSAGFEAAELGAIPPSPNALLCGALGRIRTGRIRALVVLGLGDGKLGGGQQDLLADDERRQTEQLARVHLGMDEAARAQLARLDVLQALTLPDERLWMSYPLADMSGTAQRPATVCLQLARIFPALGPEGGAREEAAQVLCAPRAALDALGVALREAFDAAAMPDAVYRAAYAHLRAQPQWRDAVTNVLTGLSARVEADALLCAPAAQSVPGDLRYSISRLETFAACPYQHFVRHLLRPRPIIPYGVQANELGSWYHKAVEAFTRTALETPGWPHVTHAQSDALMWEVMRPLMEEWRHGPLGEDARGQAMARQVCATACRAAWTLTEQLQKGAFRPAGFEVDFGRGSAPGLVLPLAQGGEIYLHGRIDRIDTWEQDGQKFLRIVDYKSSKSPKKLDGTQLYWGLQQQLPIYLAAAMRAMPQAQPAGMFYFRIDDPLINGRESSAERVEQKIAKELQMQGLLLEDAPVVQALGRADLFTQKGALRRGSSSATPEQMRRLLAHTQHKAAEFAQRIAGGDIGVRPVRQGNWCACQYCEYASVCGIDPTLEGGKPRMLHPVKLTELHEILERKEVEAVLHDLATPDSR